MRVLANYSLTNLIRDTIVLLYRFVRRSFGPVVAGIGGVLLLFLPSLFMWSVSALKESAFLTLTALTLVAAFVLFVLATLALAVWVFERKDY